MFTVTIEERDGNVVRELEYDQIAEAIRNAKCGAKQNQGRGIITDSDDAFVYEFVYEEGTVHAYDQLGNRAFNVES